MTKKKYDMNKREKGKMWEKWGKKKWGKNGGKMVFF